MSDAIGGLTLDTAPWRKNVFWLFADFLRTSPDFNPNYPHGFDCEFCKRHGIECSSDGDGWECCFAISKWLEKEVLRECD